jgi:translation elongation factor EF-G
MAEQLGKIEKPTADDLKRGRRLLFVPLVYGGKSSPTEYLEKCDKYWSQVEDQVADLELKLGQVKKIFHELIPASGEDGVKAVKDLNDRSYQIIKKRVDHGAQLEAAEESELLTEFMEWGKCLAAGLQNEKVFTRVYESYAEVEKKRNEYISKHIGETLKENEIGVLFMREGHHVQFPTDIQVIYVSPPALDEINRWLRDHQAKSEGG